MIGKKEKNWCYTMPKEVNLLVTYDNGISIRLKVSEKDCVALEELIHYVNYSGMIDIEDIGEIIYNFKTTEAINKYIDTLYSRGHTIADMHYIGVIDNISAVFNHPGHTLWSSRYCAISAFVFTQVNGETFVLANKRGKGTPDFKGFWNCPCGFLEGNETAEEGCAREVKEETGVIIDPKLLLLQGVETNPQFCNNGNVSLRYVAALQDNKYFFNVPKVSDLVGGEKNEVEAINWINIDKLTDYQWAFNHDTRIKEMISKFSFEC